MNALTAHEIAEMAGARVHVGDPSVSATGAAIDSRQVESGDLFVALPGQAAHGAQYAADAVERGAAVLLLPENPEVLGAPGVGAPTQGGVGRPTVLAARDTLDALQRLAAAYRHKLEATVVGVTGSTGKTTTKDFIAAALARSKRTVASDRSHNNEIGVPLTILAADSDTDVMVVEMAMRGPGQIAELAQIARPDIGVVTNVGVTHIQLLGSQEAIADAKGELLRDLPETGVAIVNGDDLFSAHLAGLTRARVLRYGLAGENDLVGKDVAVGPSGLVTFVAATTTSSTPVILPVPGRHNVYNALAALAVAREVGVALDVAAAGLAVARLSPMRMDVFRTADGITVINDCYNANPTSMRAALAVLAELPAAGRRVAVLGEMLELGDRCAMEHEIVGRIVAEQGVDLLITVGRGARVVADTAMGLGLKQSAWREFDDAVSAAEAIAELLSADDIVLVKGSRAVGLECVVEAVAG